MILEQTTWRFICDFCKTTDFTIGTTLDGPKLPWKWERRVIEKTMDHWAAAHTEVCGRCIEEGK